MITLNGTTGITTPGTDSTTLVVNSNNISAVNSLGFRNRIINGAMVIDQRNAGASGTGVGPGFPVDRFLIYGTQGSKLTWQQNAGAVTPPVGFTNYLGVTSSSAYSVLSTDRFFVGQNIEGLNTGDLAFGTANAATVTISFWVRSSLTGTFGGALQNYNGTRSYPFTYTISAANTWEQKTVTIAGDTSGTWLTTNGIGIALTFGLGVGSTYSGTAGAWAGSNFNSATGATSVVGTSGATFYITGVQLEAGSVASPFERRDYGRELLMCQRYCLVYSNSVDGNFRFFGFNFSTTAGLAQCYFPVTTRVAPTGVTVSTASAFTFYQNGGSAAITSIGFDNSSTKTANVTVGGTGFTVGGGCILAGQTSGNKIEFTGMEL